MTCNIISTKVDPVKLPILLLNDLTINCDRSLQTDFAKAFEMVPHHRLLYKLNWYEIRGTSYFPVDSVIFV